MPTQNRDGGANARMFKENFLAAGGLGYVCRSYKGFINMFQCRYYKRD